MSDSPTPTSRQQFRRAGWFFLWAVLWTSQWWLLPEAADARRHEEGRPTYGGSNVSLFFCLTFVLLPIMAFVLWVLRMPLPAWRGWLVNSPPRLAWARRIEAELFFGLFVAFTIWTLYGNLRLHLPLNALADACWIYLYLGFRALHVSPAL